MEGLWKGKPLDGSRSLSLWGLDCGIVLGKEDDEKSANCSQRVRVSAQGLYQIGPVGVHGFFSSSSREGEQNRETSRVEPWTRIHLVDTL